MGRRNSAVPIPENHVFPRRGLRLSSTMNTARSVWMGWATLMAAGAGAYYFAKKDINSHRKEQELKGLRETEYREC